jgi:hypothetical protein
MQSRLALPFARRREAATKAALKRGSPNALPLSAVVDFSGAVMFLGQTVQLLL